MGRVKVQYKQSDNLSYARLNFELDLPLPALVNGKQNPFYVDRPDNPIRVLEIELLSPFYQPPKWFFSGHRGCGKSTELHRLAVNPKIKEEYFPILFSIREQGNIKNIDYKDVLLAVGGQMFVQYQEIEGAKLTDDLINALDNFRTQVEKVVIVTPDEYKEAEVNFKLTAFFAEIGGAIKKNPNVRKHTRHVIEQDPGQLIDIIDNIAESIRKNTGKWPLVLIDDLDKPDLNQCAEIFYTNREMMLQPSCPIVYTVASSLFYSPEFEAIRDRAVYLPNVKLHERLEPEEEVRAGYRTMRDMILKRMHPKLITDEAIHEAATLSGGVFREMARIMRTSIMYARTHTEEQVTVAGIREAEADFRNEYRRQLSREDRLLLRDVRDRNSLDQPQKISPLLQILAALEYKNRENWCDVHPSLKVLLEEDLPPLLSGAAKDDDE